MSWKRTGGRAARLMNDLWVCVGSVVFFYLMFWIVEHSARLAWLEVVLGTVMVGVPGVVLIWMRVTPKGRLLLDKLIWRDAVGTIAVWSYLVGVSTAGFTALSSAAYAWGAGSFADGTPSPTVVVSRAYESFAWNLVDAVPVLKVPETLHWTLAHPVEGHAQGALVLVYKLVVLVPVVYMLARVIKEKLKD